MDSRRVLLGARVKARGNLTGLGDTLGTADVGRDFVAVDPVGVMSPRGVVVKLLLRLAEEGRDPAVELAVDPGVLRADVGRDDSLGVLAAFVFVASGVAGVYS
jgi:hypothetical protein